MLPAADDCLLQCQLVSRCNSHVSCVRISCAAETAAGTAGGCKSRCAAAPSSRREQAGSCTHNGWPAQCTSIHICPVCPMQEQCSSSRANPKVLSLELAGREAVFVRAAGRGGRRCASGGREGGGQRSPRRADLQPAQLVFRSVWMLLGVLGGRSPCGWRGCVPEVAVGGPPAPRPALARSSHCSGARIRAQN